MSDELGTALLQLARGAIGGHFGTSPAKVPDLPALWEPGATFVTLMQGDRLRGCIGSLAACQPLVDNVRDNACNAAFRDPRFLPLSREEWEETRVEVSLLTRPEPMQFKDEADALAQLRPGVDGIIFSAGGRRATFLPQVWEQLPEPAEFMAHLKTKAGLPADYWGSDVLLERYEVRKWKESAV
jgi:AmmeMemoRadiSam system protein A